MCKLLRKVKFCRKQKVNMRIHLDSPTHSFWKGKELKERGFSQNEMKWIATEQSVTLNIVDLISSVLPHLLCVSMRTLHSFLLSCSCHHHCLEYAPCLPNSLWGSGPFSLTLSSMCTIIRIGQLSFLWHWANWMHALMLPSCVGDHSLYHQSGLPFLCLLSSATLCSWHLC